MKTKMSQMKRVGAVALSIVLLTSAAPAAVDAFDLFFDGEDTSNPTWTHTSGLVNSTGQSWSVTGGAYRLQAPNNGFSTYGFVGSMLGSVNSDVRVEADFLDWAEPSNGIGGVFGVGARWTTSGGFNNLNGYAYAYEPFANGLNGEMVLYRINGVSLTDLGSQQVSLDPTKNYTFVLDITGSQLTGQVFEIGVGKVAERVAIDATYASGLSSVWGYSQNAAGLPATDFTVDNVIVLVPEPATNLLLGFGAALLVVVRRYRIARA